MERRGLVIAGLGLALLAACGLSLVVVYSTASIVRDQVTADGTEIRLFGDGQTHASIEDLQQFEVSQPATLQIESDAGDVDVRSADIDEIQVAMTRTAWGSTEAEALDAVRALTVAITHGPDSLRLVYDRPAQVSLFGDNNTPTVSMVVTVPVRTDVEVGTRFGDVGLTGTSGSARLSSDFGDVSVEDVKGAVAMSSSAGEHRLTGVDAGRGDVEAETDFGDVVAKGVRGRQVALSSGGGSVAVDGGRASEGLVLVTQFGDLEAVGFDAGKFDLRTSSGDIVLDGPIGPLMLRTEFGDIDVTAAKKAVLDAKSSSGGIRFTGALDPETDHIAETEFGNVLLVLPSDSEFEVRFETNFGAIRSELPVTLSGELSEDNWSGQLNGGGPLLTVKTGSGDITIEKDAGSR